jgi:SAM-dependent methyltransferase
MLDVHPSVLRNRDPILSVLRRLLQPEWAVLEIASGSGAHAAWFTRHLPALRWQPSERGPHSLPALQVQRAACACPGFLAPIVLDAAAPAQWPVRSADAIVNINMAHISPWAATAGVIQGAGAVLPPGGVLYFYGPFTVGGQHTAPSNTRFDQMLRARDPLWGIRDMGVLEEAALIAGLRLEERVPMPANNFSLVFRRIKL